MVLRLAATLMGPCLSSTLDLPTAFPTTAA
jgi:hypothetical protein